MMSCFRRIYSSLTTVLLGILLTGAVPADSLLPLDSNADLYSNPPLKRGDLVTIIISDRTRTVQSVRVKSQSASQVDAPQGTGVLGFLPSFGLTRGDQGDRKEVADTTSRFDDVVTAVVTEVQGDIVTLEAHQTINLDGKERKIKLRGKARRRDISTQNTISSDLLSDAVISVEGLKQSPADEGIIRRIFRFLF